jgi:hypothetical protein
VKVNSKKIKQIEVNDRLGEIAFLAHRAKAIDVNRRELLQILTLIKTLALEGVK